MDFLTLSLTFILRLVLSAVLFGLLILFPDYIKSNVSESEKRNYVQIFLGYLVWFFKNLIRSFFRDGVYGTFEAFIVGIFIIGTSMSLFQDEYISGLGVEVTGAIITAGIVIKYTNILDRINYADDNEINSKPASSEIQVETTNIDSTKA